MTLSIVSVMASLTAFVACAQNTGFLAQSQMVAKEEVEQALAFEFSELSGVVVAELKDIKDMLAPMFAALPKNEHGKLEPHVVRYALHRYFIQKHGWFINGLEFPTTEWETGVKRVSKDDVPSYIQRLFNNSHANGLGIHEISVFAATISRLVHKDSADSLEGIFDVLQLPTTGFVKTYQTQRAVLTYLLTHLNGQWGLHIPKTEYRRLEYTLLSMYPAWTATKHFAMDLQTSHQEARRNPFLTDRKSTFADAASFVEEFGHHFGPFQNLECRRLKNKLVDMEHKGSGRVLLSRFYSESDPDWSFVESQEYLRHLGALDETNPKQPSVLIPNYFNAVSNCLRTLSFYSVCCLNECEGLMGQLEKEISEPSAEPERIAEAVSRLESDTVLAPRNLSASLLSRLADIAEIHAGRVPLHGRLFAQWLHHAYPRECNFPHVSGTVVKNPLTPEDYEQFTQDRVVVTADKMAAHINTDSQGIEIEFPWFHEEELLAAHMTPEPRGSAQFLAWLRIAMSCAALSSVAMILLRAARAASGSKKESATAQKFLV